MQERFLKLRPHNQNCSRAVQRCQSKGGAWLDSDLQILGLWGFFASMQENQANKRAVVEIRYLETQ